MALGPHLPAGIYRWAARFAPEAEGGLGSGMGQGWAEQGLAGGRQEESTWGPQGSCLFTRLLGNQSFIERN